MTENHERDFSQIQQSLDKITDEVERNRQAFVRYIIIGSGVGIGTILTFYKDAIANNISIISFDIPLWLFCISLLLSTIHFAYTAFFSNLGLNLADGFVEEIKILSNELSSKLGKPETTNKQEIKELKEKIANLVKNLKQFEIKISVFDLFGSAIILISALSFGVSLIWSMYIITGIS